MAVIETSAPAPDAAALRRPAAVRIAWLAVSFLVLALLCVASVAFGVRDVGPGDIFAGLAGDVTLGGAARRHRLTARRGRSPAHRG